MIKTFDQFKNNTPVEEGLFDIFKARKQILEVNNLVIGECENLIQKNPKAYNDGESVLTAVADFAHNAFKKIVTSELALSFSQWWEDFAKSQTYLLNSTFFAIEPKDTKKYTIDPIDDWWNDDDDDD